MRNQEKAKRELKKARCQAEAAMADFEPNGKYRTIDVIATKNGTRLQVHARKGYHALVAPAGAF